MIVKNAEFITSYALADEMHSEGLYEVAVVGKSNVGKSSLINALANNQKLARTSSAPGKTRLINLFRFNMRDDDPFVLVDLPGYGFARVSHAEKASWQRMIEGYLCRSEQLKLALALVDIRHEPSEDDAAMLNYLRHFNIPFLVVGTKADKLSRAQQGRAIQLIVRALQVQPWQVIATSAETKSGLDKLLDRIGENLKAADEPEAEAPAEEIEDDDFDGSDE